MAYDTVFHLHLHLSRLMVFIVSASAVKHLKSNPWGSGKALPLEALISILDDT
jgi:hypothetical protein